MATEPIRVLVVDDSALMRKIIGRMLTLDDRIEIIGWAKNGLEAVERTKTLRPDVVSLDIEMPELDGLEALRVIMRDCPTRVVVLSGSSRPGIVYDALQEGAVDFVAKPSGPVSLDLEEVRTDLVGKIHAAAGAELKNLKNAGGPAKTVSRAGRGPSALAKVVAVGSSTGGPQALERLFSGLAPDFPAAILIAQHLPAGYSEALAERLSKAGRIPVREAADGDPVPAGQALVAPGGYHMVVARKLNGDYIVRLEDTPPFKPFRPSVDKLMLSVAAAYGPYGVGVILSGMGSDGVAGMEDIKRVGGTTIVQDKETSVVFGMPKAIIDRGAADRVLPIDRIPSAILDALIKMERKYERISV